VKKLLTLILVCIFTINFATFPAIAKGSKRSFSRPSHQSTHIPVQRIDRSKNIKKTSTIEQSADKKYKNSDSKAVNQTGSRTGGNFLRNFGMLAGGMMLGSMLANMFGMGMLSNIFGMLFNFVFLMLIIGALFVVGRFLWRKIRYDQGNHNQWSKYNSKNHDDRYRR